MTTQPQTTRRERAKQEKLNRIIVAAGQLFEKHGIDEVTTQQIADAADIATGTLFLYAKTKSELLLLVQNAHYREALKDGIDRAAAEKNAVDAIMALIRPIIDCNRSHPGNGRVYLREIAFGDAVEPHHAEGISIVQQTELAIAEALVRTTNVTAETAAVMAHIVDGCVLLALAGAEDSNNAEIAETIRRGVEVLLRNY